MAAYNIPNNSSASTSDSALRLPSVWKHVPEEGHLSFGRILRVFTEGAIVTLRDGKTRYTVPDIHSNNRQMNSRTTEVYSVNCFRPFFGVYLQCSYDLPLQFLQHKRENLSWPAVFDSQRAFWPIRISLPSSRSSEQTSPCRTDPPSASTGMRTTIETALILPPYNESGGECVIQRLLIDYESSTEEHSHLYSPPDHQTYARAIRKPITAIVQDWDELSGRLCVRHVRGVNYTRGQGLVQTSVRIVVIHMV